MWFWNSSADKDSKIVWKIERSLLKFNSSAYLSYRECGEESLRSLIQQLRIFFGLEDEHQSQYTIIHSHASVHYVSWKNKALEPLFLGEKDLVGIIYLIVLVSSTRCIEGLWWVDRSLPITFDTWGYLFLSECGWMKFEKISDTVKSVPGNRSLQLYSCQGGFD